MFTKTINHPLKLLLLVLLLFGVTFNALTQTSADSVGEVRLVIGTVTIESATSGNRNLNVGDEIFAGDQVTTPASGYAVVTLIDGTKFTIKPNSIFKFDTVENQSNGKVLTDLLKGGLKAITGTIGQQNPPGFKIDTPLGSIGIRGTNLDAQLCQGDECSQRHEAMGCPGEPPQNTNGLLFVTVTQGIAFLDDCENDPDINPGQVGVTDGTAAGCKVLDNVPCFMEEFVWQNEQQKDETLKSLEVPVLQDQADFLSILSG